MRVFFLSSAAALVLVTSSACSRQEEAASVPADPTTASQPQQRNQPMTVTGCLRAGEAADTLVLTAAAAEGTSEPATYELVGASAQLKDHVGDRVEVTGTLESEQDLRAKTSATETEKPKGTTGTPVVETQTKVEIRRLAVATARAVSGECTPER
jgi:hypothetical protein